MRMETREFVRGSFLENAPIVAASAKTGAGLEELRQAIAAVAAEAHAKDANAPMRLPIDRVFTIKGFGTVVTGTLISGTVRKEQEVEVHPLGRRARVRNVQVHGASAERAVAGQRTALNLAGFAVEELSRGMVLSEAGCFLPTRRADVKLELLPGAPPLKDRARIHFHAHSAETVASVTLHPSYSDSGVEQKLTQMEGGRSGYVQLRLEKPLLLLPGDRFIVRQFSPLVTIGGGVVMDSEPLAKMPGRERANFLRSLESGSPAEVLEPRISRRQLRGLTQASAIAETAWTLAAVEKVVEQLVAAKQVVQFRSILLTASVVKQLEDLLLSTANHFHDENRLVPGISKESYANRPTWTWMSSRGRWSGWFRRRG